MYNAEFIEKWKNLLYIPLDVPVPEFNYDKLCNWVDTSTHRNEHDMHLTYETESETGAVHGTYRCMYAKDRDGWVGDFDIKFPEYMDFFKSLPLNYFSTMYLVRQTPEKAGPLTSWYIHVDETNQFGLRVFLNKSSKGPTFYKIKEAALSDTYYDDNFYMKNSDGIAIIKNGSYVPNPDVLYPDPYYTASPCDTGTVSIVNNISAAHTGEYTLDGESRFFFVFHPAQDANISMIDFDELDVMIGDALTKYPEYALYYEI